jgi:hypothetical protein
VRISNGTIFGYGDPGENISRDGYEAAAVRVGNFIGRAYFGTAAGWTSFHPSLAEFTENRTIIVDGGDLISPPGGSPRSLTLSDNLGGGFAVILPPSPFGIHAFGIQAETTTPSSLAVTGDFIPGEAVTIAALPAYGYVFFHWQNGYGEIVSVSAEFSFTILPNMTQAALTLTAFYIPDPLVLFASPVLPPAALPEEDDDDYPQKEEDDDDPYPDNPSKEEDDPEDDYY